MGRSGNSTFALIINSRLCCSIPILTVHQAKGLEFDTVLIAGLTEDEFPSYYAKKGGTMEEEKRLFYDAITRARKHLILTGHRINDWDYSKQPSGFLKNLLDLA